MSLSLRRETEDERHRNNPCAKEHDLSMKCLNDNDYDKAKCQDHFLNYRYCRKFWDLVQKTRKKEGIEPLLPSPEEREAVKQKYLPHLKPS